MQPFWMSSSCPHHFLRALSRHCRASGSDPHRNIAPGRLRGDGKSISSVYNVIKERDRDTPYFCICKGSREIGLIWIATEVRPSLRGRVLVRADSRRVFSLLSVNAESSCIPLPRPLRVSAAEFIS